MFLERMLLLILFFQLSFVIHASPQDGSPEDSLASSPVVIRSPGVFPNNTTPWHRPVDAPLVPPAVASHMDLEASSSEAHPRILPHPFQFRNELIRHSIRVLEDLPEYPNLDRWRRIADTLARYPRRAPTFLQAIILERIRREPNQMVRDCLIIDLWQELYVMSHVIAAFEVEIQRQSTILEEWARSRAAYSTAAYDGIAFLYDRMGWTGRANYMRAEARNLDAWYTLRALGLSSY